MAKIPLSVVAPAHNEEGNIEGLIGEVDATARALHAALPEHFAEGDSTTLFGVEFVIVDDGSTDGTRALAQQLQAERPWVRLVAMTDTPPGKGNGQSAAFHAGFRATRGELIAVLDADLQNDPTDLVPMMKLLQERNADMVQGDRSHARQDVWIRRMGSRVGRLFRRLILKDTIRDTGCSLRLMKREIALRLPLEFRGVHRFIPASARHMGYDVVEMQVGHRERFAGETKYGLGIVQRALPGLIDCFAVRWMRNRRRPVTSVELESGASGAGAAPQVTVREGGARGCTRQCGHWSMSEPAKPKRQRKRIKWEPPVAMLGLLLLGIWLVVGPEKYPDMASLREGANVVPLRIGPAKGYLEVVDSEGAGTTYRMLFRDGSTSEVLDEPALRAVMPESQLERVRERMSTEGAGGRIKEVVFRLFDISSWWSVVWIAIGLGGQAAFFGRMFIQWIISERKRTSVVPEAFWWLSLGGGVCLFAYFAWRQDIVGVLGQTSGVVIYARNLRLIHKRRKQAERAAAKAAKVTSPANEPSPSPEN